MELKYDKDHILECFADWRNDSPDKIRISGFGVNNDGGAIACAEFSTQDRSKVMYVCLWAQKAFIVRMDDERDPFFTYFADYLGSPIRTGEEDHGDKYYCRTREEAVEKWWGLLVDIVTLQDVAKRYMNMPFTVFPTERDRSNLVYDFEHGDAYDRINEVVAVVERIK